jgi:bacteriocin biosynthesis cyclodehydratase domain-containing protein
LTHAGGPLTDDVSGPAYRLRPSVEPFVNRQGDLCLVRPGGQDLIVRRPEDADVALVHALTDGWATSEELADRLGVGHALVHDKLDALVAADLVIVKPASGEPPIAGEDAERFSRQLPYLAELGDDVALQRRLRESAVTVIGCGGLGTWATAALACIGVGELTLVDDDRVALSNLNRQILYARADVGIAKVTAAAHWVSAFDAAIRVHAVERRIESVEDVAGCIAGADAVVLVADWPPYEIARWVNAACIDARVPFIVAGQLPPLIKIGPTYIPGAGPCFACHETALMTTSRTYEDYVRFRKAHPTTAPTLGPASGVVGGLIGLELLHLLTGEPPATAGAALLIDMRTLMTRREQIDRDPDCTACKHLD